MKCMMSALVEIIFISRDWEKKWAKIERNEGKLLFVKTSAKWLIKEYTCENIESVKQYARIVWA